MLTAIQVSFEHHHSVGETFDVSFTSTELLPKHENPCSPCGATIPRNGEELGKLGKEVLAPIHFTLELYSDICVVRVTSGLDVGVAQALERSKRLFDLAVLDIPTVRGVSKVYTEIEIW